MRGSMMRAASVAAATLGLLIGWLLASAHGCMAAKSAPATCQWDFTAPAAPEAVRVRLTFALGETRDDGRCRLLRMHAEGVAFDASKGAALAGPRP